MTGFGLCPLDKFLGESRNGFVVLCQDRRGEEWASDHLEALFDQQRLKFRSNVCRNLLEIFRR